MNVLRLLATTAVISMAASMSLSAAAYAEDDSSAALAGGDQEVVVLDCRREFPTPGMALSVKVLSGGLAGLTRLELTQKAPGRRTQVTSYIVTPTQEKRPGAPVEYKSQNATLVINYTVAPRPDHLHRATLLMGRDHNQIPLLCRR